MAMCADFVIHSGKKTGFCNETADRPINSSSRVHRRTKAPELTEWGWWVRETGCIQWTWLFSILTSVTFLHQKPEPPFVRSSGEFWLVAGLYLATLALTIFQAYGLRMQRSISAYFYAEREASIFFLYLAASLHLFFNVTLARPSVFFLNLWFCMCLFVILSA